MHNYSKAHEKYWTLWRVGVNADGSIAKFHEKKYYEDGFINSGIYILNRNKFLKGSSESFLRKRLFRRKY
jgi:NDP-sugar pyrophosphorylase family protein